MGATTSRKAEKSINFIKDFPFKGEWVVFKFQLMKEEKKKVFHDKMAFQLIQLRDSYC